MTGCGNSRRFTKDAALGVNTISEIETLNIYPNPSSQYIIVDARFEENKTMNIIDSQGKSVFTFDYIKGTEPMINVASLSSGKYYLHVDGQIDYLGSFIKK